MSESFLVIGFGAPYFHAMGGAGLAQLEHSSDFISSSDGEGPGYTDESTQSSSDENNHVADVIPTTNSPRKSVPAYRFSGDANFWEADDPVVRAACSFAGSLFLTRSGRVFSCGTLHGHVRATPTQIVIPLPLKCVQLAAGRHFCLARMEGGLAVCSWGAGHFGQLGQGNYGQQKSTGEESGDSDDSSGPSGSLHFYDHPTVIDGLLPHVIGSPVTHIAAGAWHAMAVSESGQVWAWGCNRNHQCGRKKPSGAATGANPGQAPPPTILSPQLVPNLENARIVKVDGGRSHSVALDDHGAVYCWGASSYGQCSGSSASRRRGGVVPARAVDALAKVHIVDVAAGDAHTLALTGGGRVFAWGAGGEGQLGQGGCIVGNPKPKLVSDLDFVAIEAGREWKQQQQSGKPQQSALAGVPKITSILAAGNYSVATSSSGHVYAWGCNDVGNLGLPVVGKPEDLPFVEPGAPPSSKSSLRQVENTTFDSRHNLTLPQRLDGLSPSYFVESCAVGPTHMWCLGSQRTPAQQALPVGRTLYEVQETRRQKVLRKMNSPRIATSPVSTQDPPGNKPDQIFDTPLPQSLMSPTKPKTATTPTSTKGYANVPNDADNSMADLNMMEVSHSQISTGEDLYASSASLPQVQSPASSMPPSTPNSTAKPSVSDESPSSFRSPNSGKVRRRFGPIHLIRKLRSSKDKEKEKDESDGKKSSRKFFH